MAAQAALVEYSGISLDVSLGADLPPPQRTGPIARRLARGQASVLAPAVGHGISDLRVFGRVAKG